MGSCHGGREVGLEVQFCLLSSLGSFQSRTLMMGGFWSEPRGRSSVCLCPSNLVCSYICVCLCGSIATFLYDSQRFLDVCMTFNELVALHFKFSNLISTFVHFDLRASLF